jgi:hypothetical protein
MAGWTNDYENKVINHFFRNTVQAPDAALYAELSGTAPADDGTGGAEFSAVDYVRQSVTFAAASNGVVLSSNAQNYGTAASAWGTANYMALRTASSGGSRIMFGSLVTPIVVGSGTPVSFAVGKITVRAPPNLTTAYRNKVLEHFLRNNSQTPDANLFLGLYVAVPNADGTGGTEVAAPWYSRQAITFSAPSGGVASNSALITFVTNAAQAGGRITYATIHNAATAGSMVWYYPFNLVLDAVVGSTVAFAAGQISLAVD